MKFSYKSVTANGTVEENIREADDQFALARDLKAEGKTLITAEETDEKAAASRFNLSFGGVKLADKITFAKNLGAMIDAGLALSRALAVMERQAKSAKFKEILRALSTYVEKGSALSDALAKFPETFSALFVSMVRAGEESGKLGDSLRIVAEQMDRSYALRRKIRGAMMYPTIILSVMVIIGILMLMFVVPTLTATFTELNVKLPMTTQAVISMSDLLTAHPVGVIGGLVLLIIACITASRTRRGRRGFEFVMLRMPIIGTLIKETNAARMSRTFSSLLSSGVDMVAAISITQDVLQNSFYKEALAEAGREIQKGAAVSAVFARYERLFPPMVNEMIAVGEETGKLPGMLLQIAIFFEGEVDQKTKDMSTVIEPFLMVIIGAAVGFFAVSMITPIYSLSSGI